MYYVIFRFSFLRGGKLTRLFYFRQTSIGFISSVNTFVETCFHSRDYGAAVGW